jgi:hypothetical protein
MDPDLPLAELQAIHAALDIQNATLTANAVRDAEWQTQSLFLLEACGLCLGIIWGVLTLRLVILWKNQRNPFW